MKFYYLVFVGLISTSTGSSFAQDEYCKEAAEIAVGLKEDYKTLNEVYADLKLDLTRREILGQTESGLQLEADIKKRKLMADIAFSKDLSGIKGQKLYRRIFDGCNKGASDADARSARQAAREEKKRAAREVN